MMYKIWTMSEVAKADYPELIAGPVDMSASINGREQKYPFKSLGVGHSIAVTYVPEQKATIANRVRVAANKAEKRLGSKLRIYVHADCIEVARVA